MAAFSAGTLGTRSNVKSRQDAGVTKPSLRYFYIIVSPLGTISGLATF